METDNEKDITGINPVKVTKNWKVSLEEQETTINIYAQEEWADYYTCIPREIRRLKGFAESDPDDVIIEKEDGYGIFAKVKASWFPMRRPRRSRKLTDEERQANLERLKAALEAKKKANG